VTCEKLFRANELGFSYCISNFLVSVLRLCDPPGHIHVCMSA